MEIFGAYIKPKNCLVPLRKRNIFHAISACIFKTELMRSEVIILIAS
jgi:hypothetical protein